MTELHGLTEHHPRITSPAYPHPGPAAHDPAEPADEAPLARVTLSALADLDPVEQTVLRLIYWSGYSQAQVARQLAVPETTVRHCVARGMRELAEHLLAAGRR